MGHKESDMTEQLAHTYMKLTSSAMILLWFLHMHVKTAITSSVSQWSNILENSVLALIPFNI